MTQIVKMLVGSDKDVVNVKDFFLQPEENDIKKNSSCLPVLLIRTAPRIAAASPAAIKLLFVPHLVY
jgi:hypothetical protein